MEAKVNHLQRCLNGIYKVISGANNILCGISQPSVCSEVLQSPQGVAYISGVNEVYKVAKRVEGGMKDLNIDSENLQDCLRDIELTWNNLQAFLSLSPSVLHMLCSEQTLDCLAVADSANDQNETCGVCLLRTANELNGKVNSVLYNSCYYHASCANFWLNCVDSNLPGLIAVDGRSQALEQAS
ncbi:synergin gamma-like isoform X1 [Hemitrygon akajei]|uniref:synergin gamma-like isoform X1 n=1 Tax=Hemitrygon akajei TaxID=2704970 RepID=UPI003BF97AC3